jgi:hypothetical protein
MFLGECNMKRIKKLVVIVFAVLILLPVAANARLTPVITNGCWVSVTASNSSGSETLTFTDAQIGAGLTDVAILDGSFDLKLFGKSDPEIGAEFGVRAGNTDTTFSISSGLETFAALTNPTAYASAGVTLTDRSPAGATITGLYADGKINQAMYNGTTAWANLVRTFSVTGNTLTNDEFQGTPGSPMVINDTLTSIESNFYFTLTAKDSASGTSNFTVVPEPATIALLGLGVLAMLKKRKA